MANVNATIERFQAIGKGFLQLVAHQASQPRTSANPPATSQQTPYQQAPSNAYSQAAQPPTLTSSSNASQLNFPMPAPQGPDPYVDSNIMSFGVLDDLLNN